MKRPHLFIIGLSIAVGAAGWTQQRKLQRLKEDYRSEQARAAELGLSDAAAGPEGDARAPRARQDSGTRVESLLRRLAADPAEAMEKDLRNLTGSELELLSARLRGGAGIDPDLRLKAVRALVGLYSSRYPEMMLKLYTSSPEFYAGQAGAPYVVASALKQWAASSPLAAAAWARETAKALPDLVIDEARLEILAGAARSDAGLAVSLVAELGLNGDSRAWSRIGEGVKTPVEWSAVLSSLRSYRDAAPGDDERGREVAAALAGLARSVLGRGFADARDWLASAHLSDDEKAAFAGELHPWFARSESGLWLDWLGANLTGAPLDEKAGEIMAEWARKDYASAGDWLLNKPAGPLRDAAILGYAGALAPYEPAAAAEWALQLPDGEARSGVLNRIYGEWRKKDPAAAAGFARRAALSGP